MITETKPICIHVGAAQVGRTDTCVKCGCTYQRRIDSAEWLWCTPPADARLGFEVDFSGTVRRAGFVACDLTKDEMLWLIAHSIQGETWQARNDCEQIDAGRTVTVTPVLSSLWLVEANDGTFTGPLTDEECLWWFAAALLGEIAWPMQNYGEYVKTRPWLRNRKISGNLMFSKKT